MMTDKNITKEEGWAYTICAGCYCHCGVKIKVVDGKLAAIEGIPESDMGGQGGMCGKGVSTIIDYYDPNRCNYPVKRGNPKKGIHEDPKWQRISWEEAFDIITSKLSKIQKTDPRRFIFGSTPGPGTSMKITPALFDFAMGGFGTSNVVSGGPGIYCGSVTHHGCGQIHAAWDVLPDYRYCNYVLRCGGNEGFGGGRMSATAMRMCAAARDRGMRMVVMDPIGYISGAKGQEWIPILPATDIAVFLAISNLIINDIKVYDREHIRHKTNGSYLVGPDRLFVRDKLSNKPLLWDEKERRAKTYDDPTLTAPAIDGLYTVDGVDCQPAFELIKEHVKKYEPAWAEKISTVPEKTIRRLAAELVEEARIGSTIEIQGVKIPYRPACVVGYKGLQTHQNGWHQYMSMHLINTLLGNQDVAGGLLGSGTVRGFGHPDSGRPRMSPYDGVDGMVTCGDWFGGRGPWPEREVRELDGNLAFGAIFPHQMGSPYPLYDDWQEIWNKAGHPYEPEDTVMLNYGGNPVMSLVSPETAEKFLKRVGYYISISTAHNETTEGFADLVLPDCHHYESTEVFRSVGFFFNYPIGMDKWSFHVTTPAVEPKYERRDTWDIFFELANRLGFRDKLNKNLEKYFRMRSSAAEEKETIDYQIVRPDERISNKEFTDRVLKYYFGEGKGLEWFKENGFMTWEKKPEECYWRWFVDARLPVYFEHLEKNRHPIMERAEKIGIHLNWDYYTALLSYFPSIIYTEVSADSQYDLIAITPRDVLHTHRFAAENPCVDEMSRNNPYTYNITMNYETGIAKGIKDGDRISLESPWGLRVTGQVKLSQLIHPKVVAMVGLGGYARGRPIARGKGVNFNALRKGDYKHYCSISGTIEGSIRVKAFKPEEKK